MYYNCKTWIYYESLSVSSGAAKKDEIIPKSLEIRKPTEPHHGTYISDYILKKWNKNILKIGIHQFLGDKATKHTEQKFVLL